MTSSSVYRPLPQLLQKKCLLILPELPTASYVLGVPFVTLKLARGTTTLDV